MIITTLRLCGIILSLFAILAIAGCTTPPEPRPVLILGQRVLAPDPGQTLTVPALLPPAKQWYLVDDVGLGLWLGVTPPSSP